jgi:NADH-quinone oxidoreductase subunit J
MNILEIIFFGLCALLTLLGGLVTVGARNPIRSAMGLLVTILGIAGLYLMLSAEFLAAIQILVYAGAVVILFIFVIMLLGPSATSPRDARTAVPRYLGASVLLAVAAAALYSFFSLAKGVTMMTVPPMGFGSIEGMGHELFTSELGAFEISGALLLVAVVGAVALARGKQVDPTLLSASEAAALKIAEKTTPPPPVVPTHAVPAVKEAHT